MTVWALWLALHQKRNHCGDRAQLSVVAVGTGWLIQCRADRGRNDLKPNQNQVPYTHQIIAVYSPAIIPYMI